MGSVVMAHARGARVRSAALLAGSALSALLWGAPAFAQSAAGEPAVQEIIVTAQRRADRLEDVPMAVTALTSDTLQNAGLTTLHDISRVAPGTQINFAGIFSQPAIRGVTSLTSGIGIENNVAVYVDGFYVSDNLSLNMEFANLSSIEVLKGPQGTLYGRNATGGAILINTLKPSDVLTGKFEATYARFDERALSGYLSGPINDRVRVGLAASTRRIGGHLRMIDPTQIGEKLGYAASSKRDSVRLKVEADVTSDLTATVAYNYSRVSAPMNLFTPSDFVAATFPQPPLRATNKETFSYNYANRADTLTNEATLTLAWKTPIGMLTSYSGYTRRGFDIAYDFDGTYTDLTSSTLLSRQRSYQQSVDLVVDTIEDIDLVVGGLYFDDKFGKPGYGGLTNFGANRAFGSQMRVLAGTEAWAGYADATWHVTDQLSLNVGGRYSWEKKTITQTTFGPNGTITFPTTTRDASFSKFTPRASIRYEIEPRTNVYASFSQGFRSGTFNTSGVANPALLVPIRPEKVNAYEVGFKTARSRVRFDAAAFYYDYTDLNVALLVPFPGCTVNCPIANILSNAPKAKIYGVDGQATFAVTDQLNVTVGGAWLHARYGNFTNAVGTGLSATTGLNIPGQQQDWSDQQMSRAPNFSGSVSVDYKTELSGGELLLSGNANYSTGFPVQNPSIYGPAAPVALRDKQRYRRKSTFLVNAQATWTDPSDRYWVTVFGRNLTNQRYLALYNGANFGDYGAYAAPISYGATVGYKF